MNTTFKEILDRVYVTLLKDYKLDNLRKIDEEAFYTFMGGFLVNSIDMFDGCLNDLSYKETVSTKSFVDEKGKKIIKEIVSYEFNRQLSNKEVYILSLGVALGWYKMHLDDVTQYEIHLTSRSFKNFSEQANLAKRLERLNVMEENLSKEITNYQLDNLSTLPFFGGE